MTQMQNFKNRKKHYKNEEFFFTKSKKPENGNNYFFVITFEPTFCSSAPQNDRLNLSFVKDFMYRKVASTNLSRFVTRLVY